MTLDQASQNLEEILARATAGEPQIVGDEQPCVVISKAEYDRLMGLRNAPHLGRWLVENAPRIGDIDLPPRSKDSPIPFDDLTDEELDSIS